MKFTAAMLLLTAALFSMETMALLPFAGRFSSPERARDFRVALTSIIEANNRFALIPPDQLQKAWSQWTVPQLSMEDALLDRLARTAGAAKIIYLEFDDRNFQQIRVKLRDTQTGANPLLQTFSAEESIVDAAQKAYAAIDAACISRDRYTSICTEMRLQPEDAENIEASGGSVEGLYLIFPWRVSSEVYRQTVLMGGTAAEFKTYLSSGRNAQSYLKRLELFYGAEK